MMTHRIEEREAAVEAAVALLALAMHESHAPVDVLGGALERMTRSLAVFAHASGRASRAADGAVAAELAAAQETLERELAVCIESLQFHDRLMQQLAHVRDCLTQLVLHGRAGTLSFSELRTQIASRLLSDSQRSLLDLLLPPAGTHTPAGELRRINRSEGSIELF